MAATGSATQAELGAVGGSGLKAERALSVLFYVVGVTLAAVVYQGSGPLACAAFVALGLGVRFFWLREELNRLLGAGAAG